MKSSLPAFISLLFFSISTFSHAEKPVSDLNGEINHLLQYVAGSECLFIRNGSSHSGKDAVPHIQKKYQYFNDDIKTAEDFIEYSATKSTMTKKPYMIKCPGQPERSANRWLMEELKRFRLKSE